MQVKFSQPKGTCRSGATSSNTSPCPAAAPNTRSKRNSVSDPPHPHPTPPFLRLHRHLPSLLPSPRRPHSTHDPHAALEVLNLPTRARPVMRWRWSCA